MSNRSWVTLATNDSYGLGALVLAHSLRRAESLYPAVVLITPSVTEAMRERLRAVFSEVVTVDVLDSGDAAHLALLQRPELGITFTKIHCWSLTQYEKCVFLDADILVVQNCDELFEREELSAAPDVGWPDCFNSGVFVFKPSADTFDSLIKFAQERGSFDGGDQGLLNSFFSDWAHGDINKHLPFLYNVTSAAFYSYLPALKHYGQNLKIIHFIGAAKPWLQQFNWESRNVEAPEHLRDFLQLWWNLFVSQVHSNLDVSMSGVAGNLARVALGGHEAIDDLTRRQGWEAGNIDYMGVDAFENIWAKISQTLSQPRSSPPKQSPPREPTPPAAQPPAVSEKPVSEEIEVAKEALPIEVPVVPAKESAPVEKVEVVSSEKEAPVLPTEVPVPVAEAIIAKSVAPSEPAAVPPPPAAVSVPVESEKPSQVAVPDVVPEVVKVAEVAPAPIVTPIAPKPTSGAKNAPQEIPVPAEAAALIEIPESEVPVPVAAIDLISVPKKAEPETKKTETLEKKPTSPKTAVEAPKSDKPVKAAPASPAPAKAAGSPAVPETTPEKIPAAADVSTDSPPLANTPSKEEAPAVPAAKSAERRKPAGKLQLGPPAAPDPLPTPDSELEDAATLAQCIIASELRTPTVTAAAPSPAAASPLAAPEQARLAVAEPEVPTPPVGAVSLSQIGVKATKGKSSTAARIASSVTDKAEPATPASPAAEVTPASATSTPAPAAPATHTSLAEAPKKKVVKKVVKKEGAGGAEAPVPPPRKKEKKPKE